MQKLSAPVIVRHLLGCALVIAFAACQSSRPSAEAVEAFESVIPKPVMARKTNGVFTIHKNTQIVCDSMAEVAGIAGFLAEKLRDKLNISFTVSSGRSTPGNSIELLLDENEQALGEEGYALEIKDNKVSLKANRPAGLFRGVQTIRQIVVHAGEHGEIHTGTIRDYPRYAWRGSMLDVARHFFSVDDVKRYIDLISYYKMNVLHMHLSDDQGWRIEIKSWPNLTAIGGSTQVGGGKGGFYTQEQYKDIVAYAQRQYITIVPEIDMPGHINAALASYAELNAGPPIKREPGTPVNPAAATPQELNKKPIAGKLYTGIEVGFSTLHYNKDITFKFVDDVLQELAALTPGPYLHIGGDEAAVTPKDDYIRFINRFKDMVAAHGKRMVGWEEIAQGNIDSTVIVQHWHSEKYARLAADKGAKILFSPSKKVYLDMQYDSTSRIGLHWAAYIEVDSSYLWDPVSRVPGIDADQIIGVEAPLWTETVEHMDDIEYLVFPRLPGVAEIGWTQSKQRDWEEYRKRLAYQASTWKDMQIDYYKSPKVPWKEAGKE
jgi:hexosaminidase